MAGLMYSKYHAVLVILAIIASNLSLLRDRYAWGAVGIALLCYAPHIHWLYEHDFVSIAYHLYERPNGAYSFTKYTLGFFVNMVAILGFIFPLVYRALFKTTRHNLFDKGLVYLTYGILLFFFISSFDRRVQTQWIIVISIPLFIMTFKYLLGNENFGKWLFRLGIVNSVIILYLRLGLVHQPLLLDFYYESHGNKAWVARLKKQVGNLPVVFENSYRKAPMYAFYSQGSPTFSLNNVRYRKNQYSIDGSEETVRGQRVAYISKYLKEGEITYKQDNGVSYHGYYIDNFQSYRKLEVSLLEENGFTPSGNAVQFELYNPYGFPVALKDLEFKLAFLDPYKKALGIKNLKVVPETRNRSYIAPGQRLTYKTQLPAPDSNNLGYFRIIISENDMYPGLNGRPIPITWNP